MDLEKPVTESMTSALYRQIKQNLIIGKLRPGEILTLKSITESTGISQTPAREALLRLVSEHLLELVHGRSVTVPVLTRDAFIELRDIRIRLETFAIERACPHVTEKEVERLAKTQHQYTQFHKRSDHAGVLTTNVDFHTTIYRAANMPNLLAMIENLWARTGPYAGFMYKTPVTDHPDGHPHEQIIAALKKRNVKESKTAVIEDIQRIGKRMIEYLEREHLFDQVSPHKGRTRRPPPS